ncbi:MAG: c-type cytochrome [Sandaracinaceae bacterium]
MFRPCLRWLVLVSALGLLAGCGGTTNRPRDDGGPTDTPFAMQVERGAALYADNCARCHGAMGEGTELAPRLVGLDEGALPLDPRPTQTLRTTQFVTALDVGTFAAANMPFDDPGSLELDEYLAILAFALFANGFTALEEALTLENAGNLVIPRE